MWTGIEFSGRISSRIVRPNQNTYYTVSYSMGGAEHRMCTSVLRIRPMVGRAGNDLVAPNIHVASGAPNSSPNKVKSAGFSGGLLPRIVSIN